jgi:hypothetical protein
MWQTLPSTKRHILSKPLDVPLFEAMETPSFVGGNAPPDLVQPRRPGVQLRRPDAIDAHFLRQTEIIESPIVRVGTLTARQAAMKRNTTRVVAELAPEGLPNQRIDKRRLFTAQRLSALNDLVLSNATPKPVSTDSFSISFRLCLGAVAPAVAFASRCWPCPVGTCPDLPGGSLSDATSLTAPMSLVPTGCILIRDLSIKGQWTDDDRDALSNSASLGPLSLLGRNYDAGSASISVPGMQSIGWLCERMPVIPPAGDPNLPTA